MGIRFRCPNGHKLNVKDFLAGKRGICPECGIKLQIPLESDPQLVQEHEQRRQRKTDPTGAATPPVSTSPAEGSLELPRIDADASVVTAVVPESTAGNSGRATPHATGQAGLWFVRPTTGGQFGPASDDVFQSWVNEGRVTADTYVWREGWPDWRVATDALPNLSASRRSSVPSAGQSESAAAVDADTIPDPEAPAIDQQPVASDSSGSSVPKIVADTGSPGATELYRRRKSTKMAATMVVILTLACAVLAAALIYVVRFR